MNPQLYLLDGAQGLIIIPFFILHFIATLFIEAGVLKYFKYRESFGRCMSASFIANIFSLVVGLFLISPFSNGAVSLAPDNENAQLLIGLALFYFQTIVIEGIVLYIMNQDFPVKKAIASNLLMNFITYILIFILAKWFSAVDL